MLSHQTSPGPSTTLLRVVLLSLCCCCCFCHMSANARSSNRAYCLVHFVLSASLAHLIKFTARCTRKGRRTRDEGYLAVGQRAKGTLLIKLLYTVKSPSQKLFCICICISRSLCVCVNNRNINEPTNETLQKARNICRFLSLSLSLFPSLSLPQAYTLSATETNRKAY